MTANPTTITAQPGTPFIDVVRDFDATPSQVFRASTDPDLVARWQGPREVEMRVAEYDARPGGRYRYTHRDLDGDEHGFRGVFHTVTAAELVIRTFEYDGMPGQVSLESMSFEDLDGRTRVRTHTVFPSVEARDAMLDSGMEHGIRDSMDRLAEVAPTDPDEARSRVVVDISMSLDGYVAAAGVDLDHGMGVGGEVLHAWALEEKTARDADLLDESVARTGAVIMGRRTFDIVDGPNGWNEDVGYGAERDQSDAPPVFVLTHSVPDEVRLADRFVFVTDGLESALQKARGVAGGKDVVIMGGGTAAREFLRAGLVDVLVVHLAPVVLGEGTPLFPTGASAALRLEMSDAVTSAAAQHLTYRIVTGGDDD